MGNANLADQADHSDKTIYLIRKTRFIRRSAFTKSPGYERLVTNPASKCNNGIQSAERERIRDRRFGFCG
jgi:hypothetical protein